MSAVEHPHLLLAKAKPETHIPRFNLCGLYRKATLKQGTFHVLPPCFFDGGWTGVRNATGHLDGIFSVGPSPIEARISTSSKFSEFRSYDDHFVHASRLWVCR